MRFEKDVVPGFDLVRGWLSPREAGVAFEQLRTELPWEQPTVQVFGELYKVPRKVCAFGDRAYTYSGLTHQPAEWHPMMDLLRQKASSSTPVWFNTGLANYYRDGQDSIGWHSDDEPELGAEPVIASLSLGGSRDFQIRNRYGLRRTTTLHLSAGDLLVMYGRAQLDYQHSVPRRAKAEPRINLTFRKVV